MKNLPIVKNMEQLNPKTGWQMACHLCGVLIEDRYRTSIPNRNILCIPCYEHFIHLADVIKEVQNGDFGMVDRFSESQIGALASFCASVNPRFNGGKV